jgi:hypothetical protein
MKMSKTIICVILTSMFLTLGFTTVTADDPPDFTEKYPGPFTVPPSSLPMAKDLLDRIYIFLLENYQLTIDIYEILEPNDLPDYSDMEENNLGSNNIFFVFRFDSLISDGAYIELDFYDFIEFTLSLLGGDAIDLAPTTPFEENSLEDNNMFRLFIEDSLISDDTFNEILLPEFFEWMLRISGGNEIDLSPFDPTIPPDPTLPNEENLLGDNNMFRLFIEDSLISDGTYLEIDMSEIKRLINRDPINENNKFRVYILQSLISDGSFTEIDMSRITQLFEDSCDENNKFRIYIEQSLIDDDMYNIRFCIFGEEQNLTIWFG